MGSRERRQEGGKGWKEIKCSPGTVCVEVAYGKTSLELIAFCVEISLKNLFKI